MVGKWGCYVWEGVGILTLYICPRFPVGVRNRVRGGFMGQGGWASIVFC